MAEYIDRDAVYTAFANACTDVLERASEIYYIAGFSYEHVIEILDDIPAADVAPVRHGRWVKQDKYAFGTFYDCSICDNRILDTGHSWNYCPNCGCCMDGGANNG